MRGFRAWALLTVFLPVVLAGAGSSPSVNVELRASWSAAPYLLELLETAAQEDPSSYFPLLDLVAAGKFDNKNSDRELYESFITAVQDAGFLTKPEELASFKLALSVHSAAPRIQAHYHFYENAQEPMMGKGYDANCTTWAGWGSRQFCRAKTAAESMNDPEFMPNDATRLEFDRILGEDNGLKNRNAILYADILSPEFKEFHKEIMEKVKAKKATYRVRYRLPQNHPEKPVPLSGYGVELALKKTDYMVMDDREVASGKTTAEQDILKAKKGLETGDSDDEEEISDIQPLHPKDVAFLGIRAASFIKNSKDPFKAFIRMLEDFPKHSIAVANTDTDEKVSAEILKNRANFDVGLNSIMINGMQLAPSQVNPFALLEILRKERKTVAGFQSLGLSAKQAVNLLSHKVIAEERQAEAPQRFDFRDNKEGGNVIVWMNDLEKDGMYSQWSSSLDDMLDRMFPGQLPQIRKNFFHLVVPVDLTNLEDISIVMDNMRTLMLRGIGLRYGFVPMTNTPEALDLAKVIYYLMDTYTIDAVFGYLDLAAQEKAYQKANKAIFDKVTSHSGDSMKKGKTALKFEEVLKSDEVKQMITLSKKWISRLGISPTEPILFINGLVVQRSDNWLRETSGRLQADVQVLQQAVIEEVMKDGMDFIGILLKGSATRRNPYIFPKDEITITTINSLELSEQHKDIFEKLPKIAGSKNVQDKQEIWVIGDFDEKDGYSLLQAASAAQTESPGTRLVLLNNGELPASKPLLSTFIHQLQQAGYFSEPFRLEKVLSEVQPQKKEFKHLEDLLETTEAGAGFQPDVKTEGWNIAGHIEANNFWQSAKKLAEAAGFKPGQRGLVINGRVIGPIAINDRFDDKDVKQLIEYESARRVAPVVKALEQMEVLSSIGEKLPQAINLVTISNSAKASTAVFDPLPPIRVSTDGWLGEHCMIEKGDADNAVLDIVVMINPVSETAQKWAPIIKVLSQMEGNHVRIYMNPPQMLESAPIKRFYRYVLESEPKFDSDGSLVSPGASFAKLPAESLLTLGMDVPPSWLVTPKISVHDLDNIKLSAMKDRLKGKDIYAQYELRSILVEGHSRDITAGGVPKGAQFVLGTLKDPHFADTIVMANLGYFQFKANPGYWKLSLKEGRSSEVFNLVSAGTKGYIEQPGDDVPYFSVMSFGGRTLFPRLARNPGQETADVLAPSSGGLKSFGSKIMEKLQAADDFLARRNVNKKKPVKQADINIFSVASGHLYERFLNIMMLSVMKHTDKTVKFWFIENFLSPSFKDFIPVMAKEYGFEYELVTYKWPHWLRQQKEKQREIWGYKILFLDVLFPLDLDKVIFVDADQIVRTDLKELVDLDLQGAPYGFTPMCDSREEIEGFRFWKQGYWKNFLRGLPYHISALYVVDLKLFRAMAAGDRLRQHYHTLSADPNSLSNLDQDLPNHMQPQLPIFSLPQDWLWCETWCSDESLKTAKTIDLCNNPMTKEPKLDRARRQVPEWTAYDQEVAELARRTVQQGEADTVGHLSEVIEEAKSRAEESKKEETAEESKKEEPAEEKVEEHVKDEL